MTYDDFHVYLVQQSLERTLAEIGADFGVSHVAISRWLSGKRKPSRTVLLLAERLSSIVPHGKPVTTSDDITTL